MMICYGIYSSYLKLKLDPAMAHSFLSAASQAPNPSDPQKLTAGWENWQRVMGELENNISIAPETPQVSETEGGIIFQPCDKEIISVTRDSSHPVTPLLEAIFGNSPFLSNCIFRFPEFFIQSLNQPADICLSNLREDYTSLLETTTQVEIFKKHVRDFRYKASLLLACSDLLKIQSVFEIIHYLSEVAEICVSQTIGFLLEEAAHKKQLSFSDNLTSRTDYLDACGYFILGMGKLGGHELNYSSDIDLIALYDPDKLPYSGKRSHRDFAIRLTQDLVKIIQDHTANGFGFRMDLRLRPDPSATPVCISIQSAETYYESVGLNWERAAMIKARPIAGDSQTADLFLKHITPFIWRKHLDFAALADIHAIKHQINTHKGGSELALSNHNVKLGPGGIREIEFFAQSHQLIWGGRIPLLRSKATCKTLNTLSDAGYISDIVCQELCEAYVFLREVEHRLQMIDDQQTHKVPNQPEAIQALAIFLGYENSDKFEADFMGHITRVHTHYTALFEEQEETAQPLSTEKSAQEIDHIPDHDLRNALQAVTADAEGQTELQQLLQDLGFQDTTTLMREMRNWLLGHTRATRSKRAQGLIIEIAPALLKALAQTASADDAFRHFNSFLNSLPAGVQLFSLFRANPSLLYLLAQITGSAPRLAERLAQSPLLLDAVLDQQFFNSFAPQAELKESLAHKVILAQDYQDHLDLTRSWAHDKRFQLGVHLLQNIAETSECSQHLSNIAEICLDHLVAQTWQEFREQHGEITGAQYAILAFGKYGSRELTLGSDLDLVMLYALEETDIGSDHFSDGKKPLSLSVYFGRLSQRIVNAISALTSNGRLDEVDLRLRPNGNAGPIAVSLTTFQNYYQESAWTWEFMALTRARPVWTNAEFDRKMSQEISRILHKDWDLEVLKGDILHMRGRIEKEHPNVQFWNIKHSRGGLTDIEFIIQYLLLKHYPALPQNQEIDLISRIQALYHCQAISSDEQDVLSKAYKLMVKLQAILRLTLGADKAATQNRTTLPAGLQKILISHTNSADFAMLEKEVAEIRAQILVLFEKYLGKTALLP